MSNATFLDELHLRIAERIVRDVAELPDRTSPPDQPGMMLVAADELTAIVRTALTELDL